MKRSHHRRFSGQGVVEFALVAPIFFLMLLGVMEMGRLLWINHELANGTREASRFAMVRGAEATDCASTTDQDLIDAIINHSAGLQEDRLTILDRSPFCGVPGVDPFFIETEYDFDPMLGIIPGLDSLTLSARSEVIVQH